MAKRFEQQGHGACHSFELDHALQPAFLLVHPACAWSEGGRECLLMSKDPPGDIMGFLW